MISGCTVAGGRGGSTASYHTGDINVVWRLGVKILSFTAFFSSYSPPILTKGWKSQQGTLSYSACMGYRVERDGVIGLRVLCTLYMSVCSTYALHSIPSIDKHREDDDSV